MASQVYGKFHAELTGGNFHLSVNGYTFEKFVLTSELACSRSFQSLT